MLKPMAGVGLTVVLSLGAAPARAHI